jgi:glycosyltransferase involved in cell wall biosynthesis
MIEQANGDTWQKLDQKSYLLCVGRFVPQKQFRHALEVFARLLKSRKFGDFYLYFAGDGPLLADLVSYAQDLGISHRVKFLGMLDDLHTVYNQAYALLLTSSYEGFPNVLIEAIAHGTPVYSYDCKHGPSEIVKEGLNGYLTRPYVADMVECLLQNEVELSRAEIKATLSHLSEDQIGSRYLDVLSR